MFEIIERRDINQSTSLFHMKYRTFKTLVLLSLLVEAFARPRPAVPSSLLSGEDEYLKYKQAGNYSEALESLRAWTAGLDDSAAVSVNLYRIEELMKYPEMFDRGLEALDSIEPRAAGIDLFLKDRIDLIRARLLLSKGETRGAESVMNALGFTDFDAMGPFKSVSAGEFERSRPPEKEFNPAQTCDGGIHSVSWFPVTPDRTGIINFNDLFPNVKDSFFYMNRSLDIRQSGEYYVILGKTGPADMWLDGAKIYSDRTNHGFSHDQYFIRVSLPRGPHRLLIKAGDSYEGIRISLRVSSADGTRIAPLRADAAGTAAPGVVRNAGYFPSLAAFMKRDDPGARFLAGYLCLAARLGGDVNVRAVNYLSSIPDAHPRRSSSFYYLSLAVKNQESKERFLEKSIQTDPKNLEALCELAGIKMSHDFIYEASSLLEMIKKADPVSPWYDESMARLFIKTGMAPEALRRAEILKSSPFPSLGYRLEALIRRSENDYFHSIQELGQLIRLDRFNLTNYESLLDCYDKTGALEASEELLTRLIYLYPNNIGLKLRLARIMETRHGPGPSLPCLSAALKVAPGNGDVLRAIGLAYHKMGNRRLAVYYLGQALDRNPGDQALRMYLEIIRGGNESPRKSSQ
jgi:tetratricopeptide (TPR) repeat protein